MMTFARPRGTLKSEVKDMKRTLLLMLALLLVQNVISINRKLRNQNGESGDGGDLFAAPDLSGLKDDCHGGCRG